MQQYKEIKSRNRDAILFFRMGDFYEMFFEDAHLAARLLNITLTSRGDGVPLAGVPVKAAADYLRQLIAAGQRVAICEQVEDPRLARGIVRREVIETITPGAILDEGSLTGGRNNFLAAVGGGAGGQRGSGSVGLAAIDLSTGEFLLETLEPSLARRGAGAVGSRRAGAAGGGGDTARGRRWTPAYAARSLGIRSRARA